MKKSEDTNLRKKYFRKYLTRVYNIIIMVKRKQAKKKMVSFPKKLKEEQCGNLFKAEMVLANIRVAGEQGGGKDKCLN